MAIQIEIHDSHVEALIEFYIQRLRTLRDEISEKEREVKEINVQILKLKKSKPSQLNIASNQKINTPVIPYSDKWPWIKKIQFALEVQGRPLTTKEIVDTLIEYEINIMFDRKKAVASISSMLSSKSGPDKEFLRIENESGDFEYLINEKDKEKEEIGNDDDPFS